MNRFSSIAQLRKKYLLYRVTETFLFSFGLSFLVAGILSLVIESALAISAVSSALCFILLIARFHNLKLRSLNDLRVSFYLNRHYSKLYESADLLVKPAHELTGLEELQLQRMDAAIRDALAAFRFPHRIAAASWVFFIGLVIALLCGLDITKDDSLVSPSNGPLGDKLFVADSTVTPSLAGHTIDVHPPAYTHLTGYSSSDLNIKAPENSLLTWSLNFTGKIENARLIFPNGDSVVCSKSDEAWTAKTRLSESSLYQIQWRHKGKAGLTDFFKIEIKKDQLPQVTITGLPQFTRLKWGERDEVKVSAFIKDDYGIAQSHIIATVSKGTGESVKFREEKLLFEAPGKISGRDVLGKRTINFHMLGMEPGDELYFYVEAFDNKVPGAQRNRTETFFIALQDTTSEAVAMDGGLGVDLMPEYFRSQRQIIIDTEKLLKQKNRITANEFKSTSNELGYDQKVLRLRYGQFLGEEFETSIGPGNESEGEKGEDVTGKFGHQHDTENEHNLVDDKKSKTEEHHEHAEDETENPAAAFIHSHDNAEEATFFTQSIKAKLKAALTLMWDAELQLRLYEPKKSLPYQYQILKLLKEISQESRVYVHRMGFDPPPLKEEKRLGADLSEVYSFSSAVESVQDFSYPGIRAAWQSINQTLNDDAFNINADLKENLQKAGTEMAAMALAHPGDHLKSLALIRSILDGAITPEELRAALNTLQSAFWKVLPKENPSPTEKTRLLHSLDRKFLEERKSFAHE